MSERIERCDRCYFWERSKETNRARRGDCRVEPPAAVNGVMGHWPVTNEDEWCGRWKVTHPRHAPRSVDDLDSNRMPVYDPA